MRRISSLVLAAALVLSASYARAAEITNIYTNNLFADANWTDPDTGASLSVSVSRVKGKGAPVDTFYASVFTPPFNFVWIQGTLPKNALHITTQAASVEIDIADLTDVTNNGFPASGVISANWHATGVEHTSGSASFGGGGVKFTYVGTMTFSYADISGTFFGSDLVNPTGDVYRAHTSVHIHVSTN